MLELLYHKHNHFTMTVIDGSIFTSNDMFDWAIWDKFPSVFFKN